MVARHERVVLSLEDRFSREIAQAAVATKVFERSLHDLDGTSTRTRSSVTGLERPLSNVDKQSRLADRSINQLTGRLRAMGEAALTLGPALVPLGAGGVVAIAGLAAQFGALAGGIGTAVVALNGVGDALDALNAYQLEPTGDNLEKLQQEFAKLGPAGADFVVFLDQITPQLREMQMIAREGFLPGLAEGIEGFLSRGPQLNNIVGQLAASLGDLSTSAGEALGGERFDAFFDYLDREAGPLLTEFGQSLGYIAEGLANMLVAFEPASSEFSSGLVEMTERFADWSRGLQENQGFQEFLAYVRTNGPAAAEFLGSFVQALASLVEASAPIGQAVLPALTALLDVFAAIAGTPVGTAMLTAAAGFVAFNRATSTLTPALGTLGDRLFLTDRAFGKMDGSATKSRTSLLSFARSLGVVAAAMVTIETGSNIFDSLSRSFEAGDEAASSLTELEERLRESNLGKYAADLGIDVQRLAQDLAVSGTEGEYYQQVLERLGSASDGLGGKINRLSDFLGPWIGDTEQAGLANLDLGKIIRGNTDLLGSLAEETIEGSDAQLELARDTDTAATSVDRLRDRLAGAREQLKENRQDARGVAEQFVNLGESLNDSEKSLGEWLTEMERNAEALRQFQANAERAGRRGLDEGLVESLRNAGTEGALRMRELANATDEQIDRANGAWRTGQDAVKDFVKEVGGVKPKYVTRLEAKVEEALADLARLRAQLDIPDEYVNVWITERRAGASPGFGPTEAAAGSTLVKGGAARAPMHLLIGA